MNVHAGRMMTVFCVFALATLASSAGSSDEAVDLEMMTRIRDEAFARSTVMETLSHLTDVLGPRLTGSPATKAANEWTRQRLASWGLSKAHLESWGPFGRGWSQDRVVVRLTKPATDSLLAFPKAWTPGTAGPVRGTVVKADLASEADFEKWKGKLAGAVVMLGPPQDVKPPERVPFSRRDAQSLERLMLFRIPPVRDVEKERTEATQRNRLANARREFLSRENALATIEASAGDSGVVFVEDGGSRDPAEDPGPPALVLAAEHFNRIARLVDSKTAVEVEVDVSARFHDDDPMAYNTVAEIPGTDKRGELVLLGAHLDSWHAGTGANDDAAGCAVVMEAVRILTALGVKPRRTIRVALWTGEEQGMLGSRAYVNAHFASRPDLPPAERDMPVALRREAGPPSIKPDHARVSVYFNMDNGTGRVRGVYLEGNAAVRPIFEAWLRPFADLGASTLTMRGNRGTDHLSFDAVGIPGFQFVQDEADYFTRTHHRNWDVYDHALRDDLVQASAVVAGFVYNAAMREGMLPRKSLPPDEVPSRGEAGTE